MRAGRDDARDRLAVDAAQIRNRPAPPLQLGAEILQSNPGLDGDDARLWRHIQDPVEVIEINQPG